MALERENGHTEWARASGNRASDIAITHDTDDFARNRKYVELLPHPCDLIAHHAAKIFGEIENGR